MSEQAKEKEREAEQQQQQRLCFFPPAKEGGSRSRASASMSKLTDDVDARAERLRHRLVLVGLEALDDDLVVVVVVVVEGEERRE